MKIAIVSSMFNEEISNNLICGAMQRYKELTKEDFNQSYLYKVSGAFEIPFFVKKILNNKLDKFDAIVTLGCVIKGETAHFEHISESVTKAIMTLNLKNSTNIPVLYGILTAYKYEQALNRCLQNTSNKGYEVMESAIKMVDLNNSLD